MGVGGVSRPSEANIAARPECEFDALPFGFLFCPASCWFAVGLTRPFRTRSGTLPIYFTYELTARPVAHNMSCPILLGRIPRRLDNTPQYLGTMYKVPSTYGTSYFGVDVPGKHEKHLSV